MSSASTVTDDTWHEAVGTLSGTGLHGSLAYAAVYDYALTAAQVGDHGVAGR